MRKTTDELLQSVSAGMGDVDYRTQPAGRNRRAKITGVVGLALLTLAAAACGKGGGETTLKARTGAWVYELELPAGFLGAGEQGGVGAPDMNVADAYLLTPAGGGNRQPRGGASGGGARAVTPRRSGAAPAISASAGGHGSTGNTAGNHPASAHPLLPKHTKHHDQAVDLLVCDDGPTGDKGATSPMPEDTTGCREVEADWAGFAAATGRTVVDTSVGDWVVFNSDLAVVPD